MKMANMDAVLDFIFTNPRDATGVSISSSSVRKMLMGGGGGHYGASEGRQKYRHVCTDQIKDYS